LAVDANDAALELIETQQQIEHGRLAAAGAADERGHPSGLGDERHAADDRRIAPISEFRPRHLDPSRSDHEPRLVVIRRLGRRRVHELEQHAHAHQTIVELEMEANEPLGRAIA
jgi:hypothetical protein